MTRMLNARTLELDDTSLAVAEIMSQLDLENNLLAHSAAFLTCSYDFIETGVAVAVCEALPFDVVGCTSLTNAADGASGSMLLCLSVLTSDDCRFSTAFSAPITGDMEQSVREAYRTGAARFPGAPDMVMAFLPMVLSIGGELILDVLNDACGGTPVFGTMGCDFDTSSYAHTYTVHNGVCSRDQIALLLIHGDFKPYFVVTSTSDDKIQKQKTIITASEGSVLMEVNGVSAKEYLQSGGLISGNGLEGLSSVPFLVNRNDGTQPVARAIYSITPEGYAVCGGHMPLNASLSIGSLEYADIFTTLEQSIEKIKRSGKTNGLIMFPCLGRNLVLGTNILAEAEKAAELIGGSLPWHLAYSGGEICPVYDAGSCTHNRFHNYTFIACAF